MEYEIVGYGSLISHNSLKETCKDKEFQEVIIKGYKRIFNIAKNNKFDILNIKESKKDKLNAVLFKVNEKELKKLKEREDWYNFEETLTYDFKTDKLLTKALISIDHTVCIDKSNHPPNKSYFILCREAAYHISKDFGKFWDETTFNSSGKKVSDWIKQHPKYNTIN